MEIIQCFATVCPCWSKNKSQQKKSPDDPTADSNYQEYYRRFAARDFYLILHSLGCARASADYQIERWNVSTNNSAIAHAVIDSNDGNVRQALEWGMYGWHVGSKGNKLSLGVEMCESDAIKYDKEKSWQFSILDMEKATQHCRTTYNSAVQLFAYLCKLFGLDPMTRILSHKEAWEKGIGGNHGDPENYWKGLDMDYTMDGFRADVYDLLPAIDTDTQEDETPAGNDMPFPDVPANAWYADALKWAVEKKIVIPDGGNFNPNGYITNASWVVRERRMYYALLADLKAELQK